MIRLPSAFDIHRHCRESVISSCTPKPLKGDRVNVINEGLQHGFQYQWPLLDAIDIL